MHVTPLPLQGLALVELKVIGDNRGFFVERFQQEKFAQSGLPTEFAQDNHSRSGPGILRGLHFQYNPPQGKLVGVTRGRIWDVAVDVRPDSATFGQHYGVELSDTNGLMLWIPAGFAHGFCVLGEESADVLYKVTALYNPAGEIGIRYDDPDLAINWPVAHPSISERDRNLPSFNEYKQKPVSW